MYEYFIASDGGLIYPAYMSKEDKLALRDRIGTKTDYMFCSCNRENKLYYRVSADLRFIPCHQNYVHSESCVRFGGIRKSVFVHDEDTGISTAYLRFNPANFSIPSISMPSEGTEPSESKEVATAEEVAEEQKEGKVKEEKEPFSPLALFVRSINIDSYMDRLIGTGKVFSYEYFLSALYKRLQYIKISPMKKSIKELDYKIDGFKFFYAELAGYTQDDKSTISLKYFGKTNNYFVFPNVLQKALKDYIKQYGSEPNFDTERIMASGFMYERVSRRGNLYLTPGRLHLFKVNELGVYCDNSIVVFVTDFLNNYIKEHKLYKTCKLYFDLDDFGKVCDLRVDGRSDYLSFTFAKRKPCCDEERNVSCGALDESILAAILDEFFS